MRRAQREDLPYIGNSLALAKLMDKLEDNSPRTPNQQVRCSESDYQSGDFILRVGRKKIARTSERTLQSDFFYLYSRVYYRTSVGYPGRRRYGR